MLHSAELKNHKLSISTPQRQQPIKKSLIIQLVSFYVNQCFFTEAQTVNFKNIKVRSKHMTSALINIFDIPKRGMVLLIACNN